MKLWKLTMFASLLATGCRIDQVDTTPPAAPRGIQTISLDNAVEIRWLANTEPDLDAYKVWWSDRYDGRYDLLAITTNTSFIDRGAVNGVTYYYALSAIDISKNESPLSKDVIYDTPRPEGYGVRVDDYTTSPNTAGYDFSTYSIGQYNDQYTDVFFENFNGRFYLDVWSDTDIQDMGYTSSLDDISSSPTQGWAPSKSAEAIVGHTYVVWTRDNHYAKVRVTAVNSQRVVFDWAYQVAKGNTELKRDAQKDRLLLQHSGSGPSN